MLIESRLLQFEIFGFLVMKDVFTPDELGTINSEFEIGLAWAVEDTDKAEMSVGVGPRGELIGL